MKKLIFILFVLIGFMAKAQFPSQQNPTQFSTGWFKQGWPQADSGHILANRLPNFTPRFPGTIILYQQNGVDSSVYYYNGGRWLKLSQFDSSSLSNRINLKLNISDTVARWLSQSTRLVDTLYRVNDSTVGYTIKGNPYTFQIIGGASGGGGGSGTVTSVGLSLPSAFNVTPSSITTSGTFAVTGAGTTSQYIRGNSTLATTDTGMIPNFYLKVRGLFSGTSPITYNSTTGSIGINNATATGTKGAASFSSAFSDNGNGGIDLLDLVAAGSCTGCNLNVDAKGRITGYSDGAGGATDNTNIGTGYRWLNGITQELRTVANSATITWDSVSTANTLTAKVDTSIIGTQYDLSLVNNGLSRIADSTQWGQTVSASGNPAALTHNTEIPLNSFNAVFTGTGGLGIGTSTVGNRKLNIAATSTTQGINMTTVDGTGINVVSSGTGNAIFGQTGGAGTAITGSNAGTSGYGVSAVSSDNNAIPFKANNFSTLTNSATPVVAEFVRNVTGVPADGAGLTVMFRGQTTTTTDVEMGQIRSYLSTALHGSRSSAFEFHLVNNAVSARKALLAASGQWTWDGYPALTAQIDTTTYKPVAIDGSGNVVKMGGWVGAGGGSGGGGVVYLYSSTTPTGSDTSKLWVLTPDIAGVYNVYTYVSSQLQYPWQQLGWLSIDGVFSTKRPRTLVFAGQSNAGGLGDGGDTARVSGIIGYTSGVQNTGIDDPFKWEQAYIGKSPFFLDHNNIAFQIAKRMIKNGDADIVRVLGTYQGGVGLGAWITGGSHYLLDTLRNRLSRSGIDTIDVFMWHQGESGGVTGVSAGGYVVDQRSLYDSLCDPATVGFTRNYTKYIAGGLGSADSRDYDQAFNIGTPEGGQRTLNWDGNINTAWVPSWGLSDIGDAIHFSGTAIDTMGNRYYTEINKLPHNLWDENPPASWDITYDLRESYVSRLIPYAGGGVQYQDHTGLQFGYKASGVSTAYFGNDNSLNVNNVSSLPGTNTDSKMRVFGRMSLAEAGSNSVIATSFNIDNTGGGFLRNNIFGNYSTNWTTNQPNADNVFIGYNAGYSGSGRMSYNSVMVGSGAGNGLTPAGSLDYNIGIGKDVFTGGAVAAWTIAIGHLNGSGMYGGANTLVGHEITCPANKDNASAYGYNAVIDSSNQVVLGNSDIVQLKVGNKRFKINSTPTSGQYYAYNSSTDIFELTSPSSSGITTLNTLTAATQTFATGTSGTDFNISSATSTHTFNIPSASTSNRGLVTTTSQTFGGGKTFNDGATVTFPTSGSATSLVVSGDRSLAGAPGISGIGLQLASFTYTNSSGAGTETQGQNMHLIGTPTLTSSNAISYTGDVSTIRFVGAPIAAGSTTISHPWNIYANDNSFIEGVAFGLNEQATNATLGDAAFNVYTGSGGETFTLPALATWPGKIYYIKNAGGGNLTVSRAGSDNLYTTTSVTTITVAAGASATILAGSAFWYVM